MAWKGRQLTGYAKNGTMSTFSYDADGLRATKTVGGVKTVYQYVGDQLFYEKRGNNTELYYFYDSYGKLSAISYVTNGTATPFYVSTNLQGDVLSIHTGSGVKVAQYDYDAWGNATVMVVTTDDDGKYIYTTVTDESAPGHISTLNPIRYRGYYYDEDLELYYLQSRYYDSTIGRFLNADTTALLAVSSVDVTDKNLFAYCDNNPVNRHDNGGNVWETVFDLVSLGFSIYDVVKNPQDPWAWAGVIGDAVDLVPFVTGVGEATKTLRIAKQATEAVDKVADTIHITKAVDFTDEAADVVKALDRSSGYTKSTASAGVQIHKGYKVGDGFNPYWKEYKDIKGIRPDYVDFDNKIIYELKPMNPRSMRSGIRQLQKYNKALGGGYKMWLELY